MLQLIIIFSLIDLYIHLFADSQRENSDFLTHANNIAFFPHWMWTNIMEVIERRRIRGKGKFWVHFIVMLCYLTKKQTLRSGSLVSVRCKSTCKQNCQATWIWWKLEKMCIFQSCRYICFLRPPSLFVAFPLAYTVLNKSNTRKNIWHWIRAKSKPFC